MKKKAVVILLILFICIFTACEKIEDYAPEDKVVSGTLIKKFRDRKKETMVPAVLFPCENNNLVIMNIICFPPSRILLTNDFDSYEELSTYNEGEVLYELADSFDDYIIWPEMVYGDEICQSYYIYSKTNEELKQVYSFTENEFVDEDCIYCGGYNNHLYCLRKNKINNQVEVISYDIETNDESIINSFNYVENINYSLKINNNLMILHVLDERNQEVVRIIDLDKNTIEDTTIPEEISNPHNINYDSEYNLFAFITDSESQNRIYTYSPDKKSVSAVCDYDNHYESNEMKLDIRNGYVMWIQEKNAEGGVLGDFGIMMYDIDTGKISKIERAFNYNFINDNEFYYYTYPKNTDSYRVNMYKYNMKPE